MSFFYYRKERVLFSMTNIVKKKINMNDALKAKTNWSYKFNMKSYQIIDDYLKIVEHTNLEYVDSHKVII